MGVFASSGAAITAADRSEQISPTAWRLPINGHDDWECICEAYTYTITHHGVRGVAPLLFSTDLSRYGTTRRFV